MVFKTPPDNFFRTGITRIERKPGESQEQFDATKDQATYQVKDEIHTLILDGKVDGEILDGVRPGNGDTLLTHVGELAPHYAKIKTACEKSEAFLATEKVDLGTGNDWFILPKYKHDDHSVYGYELISGAGPQTLAVYPIEDGMDMTLHTRNALKDLRHSVSARITPDGKVTPLAEGVSWKP